MPAQPFVVAIDANVLICVCEQKNSRQEKIAHLLHHLDKTKGRVIIPTPALAEFLTVAQHAALAVLDHLQKRASVIIAGFDLAAAYELSLLDAAAMGRGDKKDGQVENWQKIKLDRQIVAIAKTAGAKLIISGDSGVRSAAARVGIRTVSADELELPDHAKQAQLPMLDLGGEAR